MSDTKRICTRIINKHAPTTTWDSADCTFVPEVGELIIYEPSEAGAPARIKIGDGSTYENGKKKAVKDLPFVVQDYSGDISELNKALSDHEKKSTAHITSAERTAWNGKAAGTHTHDDRYYTEKEVNDLLAGKSDTHNHPYAPTAHTHVTRDITALTGYTKASAAAEIAATDSLNVALGKIQKTLDTKANSVLSGYTKASSITAIATTDTVLTAIGKLEKALDGKSATHNHPYSPTGHAHNSSEVTKMTSYAKATAASAIATTDSLNTAIGKLEKGLDERAPRVLTGYSKATTVSALATSDTVIAALGKLEKALDGKSATHNHPYSSDSHAHGNITNAGALATANAVVVTDANKKVVASTSITTTELGYLDGVTSNIQTQINTANTNITKKVSDMTLEIYNGTSGNPKPVKFVTVNYSTCGSENGVAIKISMVSGHGNGSSYAFLQDTIIKVTHSGVVEVDNFKYYGASAGTYDGAARQYGDIFWVIDTTNKVVDFYCLMGQYARMYQSPFKRVTYSTGGTITQYTSCTVYSSGTKVYGNNSNIALMSNISVLSSEITNHESRLSALEASIVTVYSGTEAAMTSDVGEDADIYLVTE